MWPAVTLGILPKLDTVTFHNTENDKGDFTAHYIIWLMQNIINTWMHLLKFVLIEHNITILMSSHLPYSLSYCQ